MIHRESIIHSAIEYIDNSVIAQMSVPDMRHCVQYALSHPERTEATTKELDLFSVGSLSFAKPDNLRFDTKAYEFATYGVEKDSNSLLWLWILLGVVALIALIAIFYVLYIRGKLKPNFMLRFITWIVSLFFGLCVGIAKLVTLIAQGTSKKDDIDFNAFGLSNPKPVSDEEAVEEAPAEDISEEAADAPVEDAEAEEIEVEETEAEVVEDSEESADEEAVEAVEDVADAEEAVEADEDDETEKTEE